MAITLKYAGLEFAARRIDGPAGAVWQVTQAGAPITSFPAHPGDTERAVREKILRWLKAADE